MFITYWQALKGSLLRLLSQPKWLLLLVSISLMSLVYSKGTITDLPIAVIDLDHSSASRDLIRALSTSSKVSIVDYEHASDAYEHINERKVFAIITIPRDYEKKLIKGDAVTIQAFGDASSRLANGQIQQDLKAIYQQYLADYNAGIMRNNGYSDKQIDIVLSPIKAQNTPLFNAGISLAAINFPGMLVMLLQHSLLLASTRTHIALNTLPQKAILLGSLSALLPIWLFLAVVLFGLWPWILGYRQLAQLYEIVLMTIPFLFAVMGLAKLLTECLRRVEMIYLTLSFITTPVFYLSGTVWPLEAMPYWVQYFAKLLPSTWAVNMIAGVNQMGLDISRNGLNLLMLIVLGVIYLSLGIFIAALREGRIRQYFEHYRSP